MAPAPRIERRFACTGCGECCTGRGSYVIEVSRAEQRRLQRFLGITWAWLRRRYVFRFDDETESIRMHPNGDCVFLGEDRRCRIYSVRPKQCRSYPFWPELATRQAWHAEARRCEGIGRGPVIPLARLERAWKQPE
ncbi:MAG: YkgJ family cysteine cluster protein [Gammaproteobacteria bacterium]|nr:YkgJ family cysteine cluster protein [Gammaproteobacteria bacterium]MDH5512047.1 YkgJ family cysteine cluster protein [Gammaproteobacteria bacterium]